MAQNSGFGPVDVIVDVVNGLSVFRERDLNFGTVLAGTGVHPVAVTSANAGLFRIYGRRNRTVDVTLTPPSVLDNGTHTIPYTWQAAYNQSANDPAAATTVSSPTFPLRLLHFVAPAPAGQAWVWIYGSIDVGTMPNTLSGGTYTGIFTLSAAYQ